MLHYSKLMTRGSQIFQSSLNIPWMQGVNVQATAAKRLDGSILIVLHNQSENYETVQVEEHNFEIVIEPFSLTSLIFYPEGLKFV